MVFGHIFTFYILQELEKLADYLEMNFILGT